MFLSWEGRRLLFNAIMFMGETEGAYNKPAVNEALI